MIKRLTALLILLTLLCANLTALSQEEYDRMYELNAPYGFKMGAPLSFYQMNDQKYLAFVKKHFNSVTMTNEMKAYSLLDERATKAQNNGMPAMNYTAADQMVQWAQDNGIGVRGHVLVWDAYMTEWYFHEDFDAKKPYADPDTIRARTEYYITQVINHFEEKFPGVVYCWDVVNEAVADNAGEYRADDPRHLRLLRGGSENLFQKYMGDDYVEYAFLYARNAVDALGADIKLYYNDYNAYFSDKAAAILALAESVNTFAQDEEGQNRVLCDGIGMQGYIGGYGSQPGCMEESHLGMIKNAILGYAQHGFEVQVTEMAVRNFDLSQAERHAEFYAKLFQVFMSINTDDARPLKAVSIWGLTDTNAPKGNYVYNMNSPYGGLLDVKLNEKDVFWKVLDTLKQ